MRFSFQRLLLILAALSSVANLFYTGSAQAESVGAPAPQSMIDIRLRLDDRLAFCLNKSSTLVEFDRAVGELIGDTLLVGSDFHELFSVFPPTRPYEFEILLHEGELYLGVMNNCDALLGVWLNAHAIPDWLTVTRSYYTSRMVLAIRDPAVTHLDDLSRGARIGSRIGGTGDYQLRSYIQARPGNDWHRVGYPDNGYLVERLMDGTLDAILVWEPAVYLSTEGDPEGHGVAIVELPFPTVPIEFGIALPANSAFIQSSLDMAINELHIEGLLRELAEDYNLP